MDKRIANADVAVEKIQDGATILVGSERDGLPDDVVEAAAHQSCGWPRRQVKGGDGKFGDSARRQRGVNHPERRHDFLERQSGCAQGAATASSDAVGSEAFEEK